VKTISKIACVLIAILIIVVVGSLIWIKSTLPDYSGSYEVEGISGRIEIIRDSYGIPHIFADNQNDLAFGTGYCMGQDRLWQMDIFKRVSEGRLSELFGKDALEADRFARVLGFARDADAAVAELTPEEKAYLDSFLAGINRFIETRPNEYPVEFRIIGYKPEPFTAKDLLSILIYQSFMNNFNWKLELTRALAIAELGEDQGRSLVPSLTFHGPYLAKPGEHSPLEGIPAKRETVGGVGPLTSAPISSATITALLDADRLLTKYSGLPSGLIHSNCWAVSGKLTKSGMPILANDYHMPLLVPSLWYELHLSGDGIDAMGITLPGFPAVVAGHNRFIAWGATTDGADTQDIFIEKLNPDNPEEYLYQGRYESFETVIEKIPVKEGKTLTIHEEKVLISRHGPVINSIVKGFEKQQPLALKTVDGSITGSITFALKMMRAENWDDFKGALSHYNGFIWNWVYADRDGNIGFKVNGMVPVRKNGDGRMPVPGWEGKYEWVGTIPFAELPEVYNPESGYIVTANNEISDNAYPSIQEGAFVLPYRAIRIEELIKASSPLTADTARDIQADIQSKFGLAIAGYVTAAVERSGKGDERTKALVNLLSAWDGNADPASACPAVANEVFVKLTDHLLKSRVSEDLFALLKEETYWTSGLVLLMLTDESYAGWFDDPKTEDIESKDEMIVKCLSEADASLTEYFGSRDIDRWSWGELHTFTFAHPLGIIPPFKWFWNRGPFPYPGDVSTVDPGYFNNINEKPYKVTEGASMRHIIDFGDPSGARFVISTGESERWLSPYYDNQLKLWLKVETHPMWMDRDVIEKNMTDILEITQKKQ